MDSLKVKITRFNKRYVATETSTNLKRRVSRGTMTWPNFLFCVIVA